jgi:hypothetical protein
VLSHLTTVTNCWHTCQHEGRVDPRFSAAYAVNGVRVVGFDNERGKGDHCHVGGLERAYTFVSVDQLVEDFIAAVDAARRGE